MPTSNSKALAEWLFNARKLREPFEPLPAEIANDVPTAYQIQATLISLLGEVDDIRGWKVGLTSARMQAMCNVREPIAGAIFGQGIRATRSCLSQTNFVRLGLECELALRLSRVPPVGEDDLEAYAECVQEICAALEIVDDRGADYTGLSAASILADNAWNAGIILGSTVPMRNVSQLVGMHGVLSVNGQVVDQGSSDDIGGHPLNILRWLSGLLASQGRPLRAGQWISTGSIVTTKFPSVGDHYRFRLGDLPAVEVSIS